MWTVQARVRQDSLDRDLIAAVRETDARRVRDLLDRGANPNARPYVGRLTVPELVRALLTGASPASARSEPALIAALSRTFVVDVPNAHPDNTAVVQLLLQHGADPNARDANGRPALIIALFGDNGETVPVRLVAAGADVNAGDGQETALTIAVRRGDTALAGALLRHGARVDARGGHGATALMQGGGSETTDLLLEHGADPNARDEDGYTPLMSAAAQGDHESVVLLLAPVRTRIAGCGQGRRRLRGR